MTDKTLHTLYSDVLSLPMGENSSGESTIRGYLLKLLCRLVIEGSDFSSKRPFGFSDWNYELALPLVKAGLVPGVVTSGVDGEPDDVDRVDWVSVDNLLTEAIYSEFGGIAPEDTP